MGVLELLLYLVLLGVGLHLALNYLPMPQPFQTLITVVVIIVALLLVLRAFGFDVTVPKLPVKGNGLATLSVEFLIVYFLFGAFGTLLRVILAPDLDAGLNRRTVIETLMGGVVGIILPLIGRVILAPVGIDLDKIALAVTPGVRMVMGGALICLISYSGSLTVGGLMKYFKVEGGKP